MGNEPTPLGLDISLGRNLTASDVVCILNDLIQTSRRPVCLLGGSGSELISSAVKEWLLDKYVDTHHIGLGNPWHNAYCECADSMLRASYLDKLMFGSMTEAHRHCTMAEGLQYLQAARMIGRHES